MQDEELLRYSRHILLDEVGIEGQETINQAHILLVGAGGLGAPAAMYLAAAGVGQLSLVDPDEVDLTNLQRQIIHVTDSVGKAKVESAAHRLHALNPQVRVNAHITQADSDWLDKHLASVDVVLDCSDNFSTRQVINAACAKHGIPLVSGAAIRFDGQVAVFHPKLSGMPCYACAFPPDHAPPPTQCSTMGVFSPVVGVIGAMQAVEALKLLLKIPVTLAGRLLLFDGIRSEWSEMRLPKDPDCVVCGKSDSVN